MKKIITGTNTNSELKAVTRSPCLTSVNVLRNSANEIKGYVAVHRNISDRRKSEERINYLAGLVEQTSDAIFSIDGEATIVSWNKGAELMYGYTSDEAIGRKAPEVTRPNYSKDELDAIGVQIRDTGNWSGDGITLK
jgi:PAS domain-containing protein